MPRDKSESHRKIIAAASQEFMEKGYAQASMRSIAQKAGMTSAGLYRHFPDKLSMFASLVDPAISQLTQRLQAHGALVYEMLAKGDLDGIWEDNIESVLFETVIYPNFEAFKLILCKSQGTPYAHFVEGLVQEEVRTTMEFLDQAKGGGVPAHQVRPQELHLLVTAYITALTESVVHDFTLEETLHYLKTHQAFFKPGFRAVLGV